jgi:hypothetical protein
MLQLCNQCNLVVIYDKTRRVTRTEIVQYNIPFIHMEKDHRET